MGGILISPEGQNQQTIISNESPKVPEIQNIPNQKKSDSSTNNTQNTPKNTMAESEQRDRSPDVDDDDKEIKLTPRKVYKFDDPPIVFRDVDVWPFIIKIYKFF